MRLWAALFASALLISCAPQRTVHEGPAVFGSTPPPVPLKAETLLPADCVSLGWDYLASNRVSLLGFNICCGQSPGTYNRTNWAFAESSTNLFCGLDRSRTNYFAATAVDTNGLESVFSNEAKVDPEPLPKTNLWVQVRGQRAAAIGGPWTNIPGMVINLTNPPGILFYKWTITATNF